MTKESFNEGEKQEKTLSARVEFGLPGHEEEYVLDLEGFDMDHFIPSEIERDLEKELGKEWSISNRGTRLEIVNNKKYGSRDDEKIRDAISKVLAPRGYILQEWGKP